MVAVLVPPRGACTARQASDGRRPAVDYADRADGDPLFHSQHHRVPLTDALIAAAAAEHGGIALLHRDTHFDKLAEVLTFENVELPGF